MILLIDQRKALTMLENSSKNQENLDASHIGLKDPVSPVNVGNPQSKLVIHNKNKPEEEIDALKLEAQLSAPECYMNCEFSTVNKKFDSFSQCLIKNAIVANEIMKINI